MRLDEWMSRYEIELVRLREENPGKYLWPASQLPDVLDRMRRSFERGPGHYNKDSHAIRATCKHFGIPPTFTAIDRFLRGVK